jgi:hypothetical protein
LTRDNAAILASKLANKRSGGIANASFQLYTSTLLREFVDKPLRKAENEMHQLGDE